MTAVARWLRRQRAVLVLGRQAVAHRAAMDALTRTTTRTRGDTR